MVCNAISRPDFVAHETATDRSPFFRAVRRMGAWTVAWTVRSQEEMDRLRGVYDLQIFDSFRPAEALPEAPEDADLPAETPAEAPDEAAPPEEPSPEAAPVRHRRAGRAPEDAEP